MNFLLHEQIQRQRQQGGILVFGAIAGHQQKQKNDQQIPSVQISWQKLP